MSQMYSKYFVKRVKIEKRGSGRVLLTNNPKGAK